MPDRSEWAARMRQLLDLEREAEAEETRALRERKSAQDLAASGLALLKLTLVEEEVGAGGRRAVILGHVRAEPLPAHRFRPGDLVELTLRDGQRAATGVVSRTRTDRITILLDPGPPADLTVRLDVWRLSSDVTWRRMARALDLVESPEGAPGTDLVLLAFRDEPTGEQRRAEPIAPLDEGLDPSQVAAVSAALDEPDLFLLHGPPGTGKTTALVEYVRQEVRRGRRVLATAATNVAVDHLGARLATHGESVLRLGHPARITERLAGHTLDARMREPERARMLESVRREIERDRRKADRARAREARRAMSMQIRQLERELKDLERSLVHDLIRSSPIVLCTATGAGDHHLNGIAFDVVVLDEATQALEPASWIPLMKAGKAVLAGDHHQLPPTILSQQADRGGLGVTLFDRLTKRDAGLRTAMLTRQYRMHGTIMAFSAARFYEGKLEADDSVRAHRLDDLADVTPGEETGPVLMFIDTSGRDFHEEVDEEENSRRNPGEADLLERHARALVAAGLEPSEIAAISPYYAQVRHLRDRLHPDHPEMEVDTVDGFQGREKEAILISLVRSNTNGEVGFLADPRRLNVALTRGRRQVVVIGDASTVANDPFLAELMDHLAKEADYRSAWEYT